MALPLAQLHKAGRFPFDKVITYYDSLSDINKAISDVSAGRVVKPVLRIA
jgi:aryl-alcohol dehydrogenase